MGPVARWSSVALALLVVGACAATESPRGATSGTPVTSKSTSTTTTSTTTTSTTTTSSTTTSTTTTSTTTTSPTTTTEPPLPPTTAAPRTTTTVLRSGVPEGFCAGLALESASITRVLEELDASGASETAHHLAHLRATTTLLGWINERVPAGLRDDSGLLDEVYTNIDGALADLEPGTVTDGRLRNVLFGTLLDSSIDGLALDGAAGRLADWVEDSCGTFPMVAFVADLFAAARLAEGDELVFEFPGDR